MTLDLAQSEDGAWLVRVRVQPKAKRNAVLGTHDGALKLAVTAAPEKGKANDAVCKLLAAHLGISTSQLSLVAGQASRDKRVAIRAEFPGAEELCNALLDPPGTG